jgi:hypothetical protein
VGYGPGNGLLKQLAIADRPGGPAMPLPLGRHHQRHPAQLMGRTADGGISPTGPAMENQVHQPAPGSRQQLGSDALMGPGQIAASTGGDHKRASRGLTQPG